MARKRRVGRPRVKGGPRKLTNRAVKSYMSRGLGAALKKGGRKRGTFKGGGRRGRKAGFKHSALPLRRLPLAFVLLTVLVSTRAASASLPAAVRLPNKTLLTLRGGGFKPPPLFYV